MNPEIKVDIEELVDRLKQMLEDGYATVKITINESEYYDEGSIELHAVGLSAEECEDYGEIGSVSDEFLE